MNLNILTLILYHAPDRRQCPAAAHSLHHSSIHPPEMINADFSSQRTGLLTNIPSSVLISLIVIIVLTIICLLVVYAKRKWKIDLGFSSASQADGSDWQLARLCERLSRCGDSINRLFILMDRRWRNRAAATSMNQQRDQTGSAATTTQITPTNNSSPANLSNSSPQVQNQQRNQQQQQALGGMQLHNMRPPASNTSSKVSGPTPAQCEPVMAAEPTALDLAQSAAARVTGSAAAAIAAAKFKMLRSNTLAAAFGRGVVDSDLQPAMDCGPVDLMAVRTKDERIINTLSSGRNRLNLDAKRVE